MAQDLTCSQVIALLTYYVQGKTNYQVTNFIESHLKKCKSCRAKLETLKKVLKELEEEKNKLDEIEVKKVVPISSYGTNFIEKMSAYLDNELSDEDTVRFKRFAIANPPVRKELEAMYKVKNAINSSFEKTKNTFKDDFTKDIIVKLNVQDVITMKDPVFKIVSVFVAILTLCSLGVVILF